MNPAHPFRRLLLVLVATGLLFAGSASASASAPEPEPGDEPDPTDVDDGAVVHSFALLPASENDQLGSRTNFSYSAGAGSVVEDAVTVLNLGNEGLPFRLYATDAFNNESGDFSLLPGDDVPTGVGSWVEFEQETFFLPPGSQVTIEFTMLVPDAAAAGDHSGAILVSSPTVARGEQQEQVTVDRRVGSRLFVRVDGAVEPQLAIENVASSYDHSANPFSGSQTVDFRIENRGNVRLSGAYEVGVAGPLGIGRTTLVPVPFDELLPGEGFDVSVEVQDVPATFALNTVVSLVDVTQGNGGELDPVLRSSTSFAPPITLLLVVLLVVFGLVAWRAYRRHQDPPVVVIGPDERERELQTT